MPEGVGYSGSNVVAGAGLELNVVGDYAYAYSGLKTGTATTVTYLSFTTGNYILVGTFQLNSVVTIDDPALGDASAMVINFNGVPVSNLKADGELERAPASQDQEVIIPPYTVVLVTIHSGGSAGDSSATFTGRIYK
jgi:hypothetical protein